MRFPAGPAALFLAAVVAGCLDGVPRTVGPDVGDGWTLTIDEFPVALDHDHTVATDHKAALGFTQHARASITNSAGVELPVFNLAVAGNRFAASAGGPAGGALAPPMSLILGTVLPESKLLLHSSTPFPGGGVESVALSADGQYAFLGTEFSGAVGIFTINVADPREPAVLAFTPLPTEGPHNVRYGQIGNRHFVFASISHVSTGAAAATGQQDPLPAVDLRVDILEFVPNQAQTPMTTIASYKAQDQDGIPGGLDIVHDAVLQVHPITKQPLLYVAHWDRGVRIVDLSEPVAPDEVGKYTDPAPTDFLIIHTVKPHPGLIDGRHYTVATSQCAYAPASKCFVRVLDTTDPADPKQVATWTLPDEVHGVEYTTEIFDLVDGRVYVPWAHAGTWALDLRGLPRGEGIRAVGYFFGGEDAAATTGVPVPDANAVAVVGGTILVADIYTGLRSLTFTEPTSPPS